jgi:hypothetical protein
MGSRRGATGRGSRRSAQGVSATMGSGGVRRGRGYSFVGSDLLSQGLKNTKEGKREHCGGNLKIRYSR